MFTFPSMECDKNYQDLIKKYQILLENEKRRLTPVNNFNLTEKNEKNNSETIVEDVVEITESPASLQGIAKDQLSARLKNIVNERKIVTEIVHNIPQETRHDIQKRVSFFLLFFISVI